VFVESQLIKATPRLGARDATHPKGYEPGQVVILRVLDENNEECLRHTVRIDTVTVRPIAELTSDDLQNALPYHDWRDVQHDLSLFEQRPIDADEEASIIEFPYL
jgi:hypothetical protein